MRERWYAWSAERKICGLVAVQLAAISIQAIAYNLILGMGWFVHLALFIVDSVLFGCLPFVAGVVWSDRRTSSGAKTALGVLGIVFGVTLMVSVVRGLVLGKPDVWIMSMLWLALLCCLPFSLGRSAWRRHVRMSEGV